MSAVTVGFQVPPSPRAAAPPITVVEKPAMLMVSHCLPQSTGDRDRRRSWALLESASQTHRLWVAALADGPVHLSEWDAVAARCEQFVLLPRGLHGLRLRHLRRTVRNWSRATPFNAALSTAAHLSPIIEAHAPWRICDMAGASTFTQVQGPVVLNVPHDRAELLTSWMQRIASGAAAVPGAHVAQAA